MTTKEDILSTAESLEITLLDEEVQEIIDVEEMYRKEYPESEWSLKEQIYNVIEPRSHAMQDYKCPKCKWIGTMDEMINGYICPQCKIDIF